MAFFAVFASFLGGQSGVKFRVKYPSPASLAGFFGFWAKKSLSLWDFQLGAGEKAIAFPCSNWGKTGSVRGLRGPIGAKGLLFSKLRANLLDRRLFWPFLAFLAKRLGSVWGKKGPFFGLSFFSERSVREEAKPLPPAFFGGQKRGLQVSLLGHFWPFGPKLAGERLVFGPVFGLRSLRDRPTAIFFSLKLSVFIFKRFFAYFWGVSLGWFFWVFFLRFLGQKPRASLKLQKGAIFMLFFSSFWCGSKGGKFFWVFFLRFLEARFLGGAIFLRKSSDFSCF